MSGPCVVVVFSNEEGNGGEYIVGVRGPFIDREQADNWANRTEWVGVWEVFSVAANEKLVMLECGHKVMVDTDDTRQKFPCSACDSPQSPIELATP